MSMKMETYYRGFVKIHEGCDGLLRFFECQDPTHNHEFCIECLKCGKIGIEETKVLIKKRELRGTEIRIGARVCKDVFNIQPLTIAEKCERRQLIDEYYIGAHKVDVKLFEDYAIVSWHQGGLIPKNYDRIKVKKRIVSLFRTKSFEERLQEAIYDMQLRCDRYDELEIKNFELKQPIDDAQGRVLK